MVRLRCLPLASLICAAFALGHATPIHAQATSNDDANGNAIDTINDGLNSNEGGAVVSIIKDSTDHGLNAAAAARQGAAWRNFKMGASPAGHLEIKGNLKSASGKLGVGGTLIDHTGYASTAAGEIAEGKYAQGFITIVDGFGKSVVSGIGAATGASFGSLVGPAGTIIGGTSGGYAGSQAWDASVGKLTAAMKAGLAKQEEKRQFRELAGPRMLGQTADKIHQNYQQYRKELDAKHQAAAAKAVTTKPAGGKLALGSQTAVYDPAKGGGDNIRVTVSGVANFKQQDVPGWRNNGTSFGATGSRSTPIAIQGTIVTKPWSYYDFNNSVTIKADGKVVYGYTPKIPKEGGTGSFSFTFDPASNPGVRELTVNVSSTGGNPESSTHWVGGTIQIGD